MMAGQKMTQEEYVRRAKERHGIAYSYAKTVYTHSHNKVVITCPKHGDWEVTAAQHIRRNGSNGCPSCAGRTFKTTHSRGPATMTTAAWVAQAKAVHGDLYDYSTVHYQHSLKVVNVTCRLHGPFAVTPGNHVRRKSGCPICAGRLKESIRIFTIRAKTVHGTKYDYKFVTPFKTSDDIVTITCPTHGNFDQRIQVHLDGAGCQKCGHDAIGDKQRGVKKRKMKVVTI